MGLRDYRNIEGDIIYKGESLRGLSVDERARRGITLAWQKPARYEGLTVNQFLAAAGDGGKNVREAIRKVGMDPGKYLSREVVQRLSSGERKRIELASVLAKKPELALLDEPAPGMNVDSLDRMLVFIERLKANNATVVFITKETTFLEVAERAFLMQRGGIIERGDVDRVIHRYLENERKMFKNGENNPGGEAN